MGTFVKLDKIPYYNSNTDLTKAKIANFAYMPDSEVIAASITKTEEQSKKSIVSKANKAIFPATVAAFILNDTLKTKVINNGIIKNAPPSVKFLSALKSISSWLLLFATFKTAQQVSGKVSENTQNEDLKNTINTVGTIGGGFALYTALTNVIKKGAKKLYEKMPETVKEFSTKAEKFDNSFLNNTVIKKINKNVVKPLQAFGEKHQKITKFGQKWSGPIIFGAYLAGSIILGIANRQSKEKKFKENMKNMLQTRQEARSALNELETSKLIYDNRVKNDGLMVDIEKIIENA